MDKKALINMSADENSLALAASSPASTACFPAASNAVAFLDGNGIFTQRRQSV